MCSGRGTVTDAMVRDVLDEMRGEFLAYAASLCDEIERLIGAQDLAPGLTTLVRTAHTLKGAGGTFGYGDLSEAAAEVERLSRTARASADRTELCHAVAALRGCLTRLHAC